jgi:hypothetical protein
MAHRLIKQAVAVYVPAVAEVVATPAYSEVIYVKQQVLKWTSEYKTVSYTYLFNDQYITVPTRVFAGKPYYVEETVPVYVNHPAVAGVPGRDAVNSTDGQIGWNGGAQSVYVADGDFSMLCTIRSTVQGVLVGMQPPGAASGNFNAIEHGVLISGARPSAVERGAIKASGAQFAGDFQVLISRSAGIVTCRAGSLTYTSTTPSIGPMVMSAVMYAGTDYVDDPEFADLVSLSSAGGWGWGDGSGVYALRVLSPWGWGGYASVNNGEVFLSIDVDMLATDEELSSASMVMDEPTILKAAGFSDIDLGAATLVIPMAMQALGTSSDVGNVAMSFGMTMRAADYDYGEASLVIDGIDLFALSDEQPEGYVSADDAAFMGDFYIVDPVAYASLVESLTVSSSIDLLMSMDVDLADHLVLMDDASVALIIQALLENKIGLADASIRSSRDIFNYVNSITGLSGGYDFSGHTYATNLVTGAVSRYAGFDFNGFCRVGMKSYAFRPDGLYVLGAESDNGTAIGTRVDFAAEDFGSPQSKRVGNIFMGLSTDGQVFVRTEEDGEQEMIYRAYQRENEFRADMQRGRASRFWRLRLEVVDASYVELDNIEWVITPTGRR